MTEDEWKQDVTQRIVKLERHEAVAEVHYQNVENRLSGVENVLKRLSWIVITAVILAGLKLFFDRNLDPVGLIERAQQEQWQ